MKVVGEAKVGEFFERFQEVRVSAAGFRRVLSCC